MAKNEMIRLVTNKKLTEVQRHQSPKSLTITGKNVEKWQEGNLVELRDLIVRKSKGKTVGIAISSKFRTVVDSKIDEPSEEIIDGTTSIAVWSDGVLTLFFMNYEFP